MKFKAIYANEQAKINRVYAIPLCVFLLNIIISVAVFIHFFNVYNVAELKNRISYFDVLTTQNYINYIHMFAIGIIVPFFAMGSVCIEKNNQELYTIFLSGIKPYEFILGKTYSYIISISIILISTIPIYLVSYIFGGFDSVIIIEYLSFLICNSILVINGCITISSIILEQNTSSIICYIFSITFEMLMAITYINVLKSNNTLLNIFNASFILLSIILFYISSKVISKFYLGWEE